MTGKRERNKAEKRRRIIEAAGRLFEKQGFEATTTAEISAAADVGTGTLYLYVDSKEDLLVAVFQTRVGKAWAEAFAVVDRAEPLIDQLLAVFGQVTRYHLQDRELSRAFFKELLFVTGTVADAVDDTMRRFYTDLDRLLADAQANGLLDPEVQPRALSRNLFAAWYLSMQRLFNGPSVDAANHDARIEASFRTALLGLTPRRRGVARPARR